MYKLMYDPTSFTPFFPPVTYAIYTGGIMPTPIEVDAPIAGRTPHRTVREAFPHTAPYKSDTSVIIRRR